MKCVNIVIVVLFVRFRLASGLAVSNHRPCPTNRKSSALMSTRSTSAPPDFVRIRTTRGNRQQILDLETAITTLVRNTDGKRVELHAQIHFGSKEYFEYYNSREFSNRVDRVLYELLVDEELTTVTTTTTKNDTSISQDFRVLRDDASIMASPSDRKMARQYGLSCQVDVVDYTKPKRFHADLTRQEFKALLGQSAYSRNGQEQLFQEPLWALASTSPTWPGAEAVSAIFRPSTPSTPVGQRLFSNLFLPGSALATVLRLFFWILVPAPELSVMVLDWSSILPRPTGGVVSPVAMPVLESLFTGNIQQAQQLVFGQVLVAGQKSSQNGNNKNNNELLIDKRNDHALEVLASALTQGDDACQTTALLYGAMHCPDLYRKLIRQGFVPSKTTWRTAWSVRMAKFGTSSSSSSSSRLASTGSGTIADYGDNFVSSPNALAVGLVVVPFYLAVGGFDWISTLHDVEVLMRSGNYLDVALEEVLYLVRHVALYLSLVKFVVQWDDSGGVGVENEGDESPNSLF